MKINHTLLFFACALLLGCTKKVFLKYNVKPLGWSESLNLDVQKKLIVLLKFQSELNPKNYIGDLVNRYGIPVGEYIAENDVEEWFNNALELELKNRGYNVIKAENNQAIPVDYPIVAGNILRVYKGQSCDTVFMGFLKYKDKVLVRDKFSASKLLFFTTQGCYQGSLQASIRDFILALDKSLAQIIE